MPALPMFPLGTVVVPHMVLPLHVFEPRYRQLVRDCLGGDGEFGVVLIARGSEVGGGDVRTDVGTVVRIARADEQTDGRFVVAAIGLRRLRVERWLDDDPYPQAEVADWPDVTEPSGGTATGPAGTGPGGGGPGDVLGAVPQLLQRASALRAELGEPAAPLDHVLSADPVVAGYEATALAPLGPADKQALLCAPTVERRLGMLGEMLTDQVELLAARLGAG